MKVACTRCSAVFYGWTQDDSAKRKCDKCGGTMELVANVPISKLSDVLAIHLRHKMVERLRNDYVVC